MMKCECAIRYYSHHNAELRAQSGVRFMLLLPYAILLIDGWELQQFRAITESQKNL